MSGENSLVFNNESPLNLSFTSIINPLISTTTQTLTSSIPYSDGHFDRLSIVQIDHYATNWTSSTETDKLFQDDAVWIITSSFIIFTMHSGFGLLESGSVSAKDEVNIMVKNVVDVVFGGVSYWALGFGLSFGDFEPLANSFCGFGKFFYDPTRHGTSANAEGWAYASFLFQLSLATTASTIVSGAVAERAKLKSYILLGCIVIIIQALPAHWIWAQNGFFFRLGVIDFAGCSAVHMVGGIIGLIATIYLRPRRNRFSEDAVSQMSSPTNALLGTFLLWWGWFGINAGSVWGITNGRWRLGARAAVATIMSSIGGGSTAIIFSFIKTKKLQVNFLINGILSSIVSITAMCAVARPWHSLVIGSISSAFSILVLPLLDRLHIDDPVGIVPIHLTSSIWGMMAVGIFAEKDRFLPSSSNQNGLLYGGGLWLLGIQLLCTLTVLVYSASMGIIALFCIAKSPLGLRVTDYEEQIGADVIEHGLAGTNVSRYVVEKPLSTKTFLSVTKAITKWKMLTKQKNKAKRMETMKQRRDGLRMRLANGHTRNGALQRGTSLQLSTDTKLNQNNDTTHLHNGKLKKSVSQNNSPRDACTPVPTPRTKRDHQLNMKSIPENPTDSIPLSSLETLHNHKEDFEAKKSHITIPIDGQVDSGLGTEGAETPSENGERRDGGEEVNRDGGNGENRSTTSHTITSTSPHQPSSTRDDGDDGGEGDGSPVPRSRRRSRHRQIGEMIRPTTVSSIQPRLSAGLFRRAPLPRPISPPEEVVIWTTQRATARYTKNNRVQPR
ncbi:unnamed protein product, partial [Mesorhabditis belari]|uniref:Ammonium transporter n=1 Tax=Mesorhabditis belari TaxID=2138241 RepID=A0AAF3ENA8_9BILA